MVQCVLKPRSSIHSATKGSWTVNSSFICLKIIVTHQYRISTDPFHVTSDNRKESSMWFPSRGWRMKPKCGSSSESTQLKLLEQLYLHKLCPLQMSACMAAPPHFHNGWYPSNRSNAEPDFNCSSLRYGVMALTGIRWRHVMRGHLCFWTAAESVH